MGALCFKQMAARAVGVSFCRLLRTSTAAGQPKYCARAFSIAPHIHNVAGTSQSFQQPTPELKRGEVVVVTSGKGGVGKTTTAASFGYGLASAGYKTCLIDFDIGLRNLDIHLGMERRVVYDFVNCILGECRIDQALIKDRRQPNLHLLAASQTRDKSVLSEEGVQKVLDQLTAVFDYVICDSPAGIEAGAMHAMYFADSALVCTNPELSSVRDSDRMIGLIASKSRRAVTGDTPVKQSLVITRYQPERVANDNMISVTDIEEMLGVEVAGVIPESKEVLSHSNMGQPVVIGECAAADCYDDMVQRFVGNEVEFRHLEHVDKGFFGRIFG